MRRSTGAPDPSSAVPDLSYTIFGAAPLAGRGCSPDHGREQEAKVDRNLATMLKEIARLMAASDCRVSRRSSSLGDDHERPGMTRVTSTSAYWRHPQRAKYAA